MYYCTTSRVTVPTEAVILLRVHYVGRRVFPLIYVQRQYNIEHVFLSRLILLKRGTGVYPRTKAPEVDALCF
ncbi:hypothetical protein Cagg_2174 [Chloroflexus aggregans DSM 9485]|uniref:Uncharacterized protein n=1 Tax=Chloroflexus aggregans (strain MD-66 / DSM 9485) TaxID=326427 RepID=B8GCL3_CHLAD|nr:hypothetical protein Cagg_2174 [Chloroflexus aggregans DSM 9485]